jgi:hypothetical protein
MSTTRAPRNPLTGEFTTGTITYTTSERKEYGRALIDGEYKPLYHQVSGPEKTGEIWCPGPLPGTVWVLDPEAPAGARAVDVHSRYGGRPHDIGYQPPQLSGPRTVTSEDYRAAEDIHTATRAHDNWSRYTHDWRGMSHLSDPRPERPAADRIAWAEDITARYNTEQSTAQYWHELHGSGRSISDKAFRQLALIPVPEVMGAAA